MDGKWPEIEIPPEHGVHETAILMYLYENSEPASLGRLSEALNIAADEALIAVENLLVKKFIKAKRVAEKKNVSYVKIQLTNKGEVESIKAKRAPSKIILDIPRPKRENS